MAPKKAHARDLDASSSRGKRPKTRGGPPIASRRRGRHVGEPTTIVTPSVPHPQSAEPAPPVLHKWLRFTSDKHKSNLKNLLEKNFDRSISIHWPSMEALGFAGQLKSYFVHSLPDGGTTPEAWLRLFEIREPVYKELCYEFFSTFDFEPAEDYDKEMITFRLGGIAQSMTLCSFATTLGLYTPDEVSSEDFTYAMIEARETFSRDAFWREVGEGTYNPHNTRATSFIDPVHQILHRALAESILGRGNTGAVSVRDLQIMSMLLDPTATFNVAFLLADFFSKATGVRHGGCISGGSYVTRLAKQLGILTEAEKRGLTVVEKKSTALLDLATLRRMGMIDHSGPDGREVLVRTATGIRSAPSTSTTPTTTSTHTTRLPTTTLPTSTTTTTTTVPILSTTTPITTTSDAGPSTSTGVQLPTLDFGTLLLDPVATYTLLVEIQNLRQGISELLHTGWHPPLPPPAYRVGLPPPAHLDTSTAIPLSVILPYIHQISSISTSTIPPPPHTSVHQSTISPVIKGSEEVGEQPRVPTSTHAIETAVDSDPAIAAIDLALAASTAMPTIQIIPPVLVTEPTPQISTSPTMTTDPQLHGRPVSSVFHRRDRSALTPSAHSAGELSTVTPDPVTSSTADSIYHHD